MKTYGDLFKELDKTRYYTEKEIWIGDTKRGYRNTVDGKVVAKKKEAMKYSAMKRNKEVLFMGKRDKCVVEQNFKGMVAYGYLVTDDQMIIQPNPYEIKERFCVMDTGEFLFNVDEDYTPRIKEIPLETPVHILCPRCTLWREVKRVTTKMTDGRLASDVLMEVFNKTYPTEEELDTLQRTSTGKIAPNTIMNRVFNHRRISQGQRSWGEQAVVEITVEPDTLDPIITTNTGVFVDVKNNEPVFRVFNKGHEIVRIDLEKNYYTRYNNNLWAYNTNRPDNITEILKTVYEPSPEKLKNTAYEYAVIDYTKPYKHVAEDFSLNTDTPYEQIMKTEYKDLVKEHLDQMYEKKRSHWYITDRTKLFKAMFACSSFNKKGNTLYQKLKLNKYQFQKIMEGYKSGTTTEDSVKCMRYITQELGIDMPSLNNEDTDIIYEYSRIHTKYIQNYIHYGWMSSLTPLLSCGKTDFFRIMKMFIHLHADLCTKYKTTLEINRSTPLHMAIYQSCWDIYTDFYSLRAYLLQKEFIRKKDAPLDVYALYNNSLDGFQDMHDQLVEWTALEKEISMTRTTPEWDANYEEWKKLEYRSTKHGLCVIAPTCPGKLAEEGKTLHHCVAGYIDRVTKGETSVLFIRENDSPEKPYFTVEVQNGLIRQIHGLCNQNPDRKVVNFVKAWAKARDLKLGNYKRCLA